MSPGFKFEKQTVFGEPAGIDHIHQVRSLNDIYVETILTVLSKDSIE